MNFNSKIVVRLTGANAGSTHTANALRAQNNGGFSNRGTSTSAYNLQNAAARSAGYSRSKIGSTRNNRPKAMNIQEQAAAEQMQTASSEMQNETSQAQNGARWTQKSEYQGGYASTAGPDLHMHKRPNERMGYGHASNNEMRARGRFDGRMRSSNQMGASRMGGAVQSRTSSATPSSIRPTITPNFRQPS